MLKITIENQQILKRLQDKNSHYSVVRWEEDFKHKEKIMKNMCEYPFILDGSRYMSGDQQNPGDLSNDIIGPLGQSNSKNQFLPRLQSATVKTANKSFSTAGGINESLLGGKGQGKPLIR